MPTQPEATEDALRQLVVDVLGVRPELVTADAHFIEGLGVDSLDAIELAVSVEEEFDVEVTDDEIEETYTFGRLCSLVASKLGS